MFFNFPEYLLENPNPQSHVYKKKAASTGRNVTMIKYFSTRVKGNYFKIFKTQMDYFKAAHNITIQRLEMVLFNSHQGIQTKVRNMPKIIRTSSRSSYM